MRRSVAIAGSTLLLFWVATGIVRVAATAPTYTVVDLGTTSDGYVPSVTGINANGQVSGTASTSAGQRPVRYTSGVGFEYLAGVNSAAGTGNAIDANGEVAGYTLTSAGQRAYLAGGGTPSFVSPEPGGTFTFGWAVNSLGVIAGYGNSSAGVRAFSGAPGQLPQVLPTLGGTTFAFGINDSGQVVGASVNGSGVQHAYRANPDGTIEDLGSFSTGASIATAIDKGGDVVGRSVTAAGVFHAFRYTDHMQDIDTLGSSFSNALAVSGAVTVGTFTAPDGTSHGFVHTFTDGMIDLNTRLDPNAGWVLSTATGVNSNGQIVGMGLLNGVQHAYLLTPDKPADTTPPTIGSLSADPSTITPANNRIVSVTISVTATDDDGQQPACKLTNVASPGAPSTDYSITSDATGTVKAVGGRTYTFTETCTDAAGNSASASTDVVVPPDTTPPTITSMSATPASIWPPNFSMVTVTVSVTATDDADPAPACSLTSISGGPSTDESITGQFTGSVKAVGGRTYSFTATCADFSGNKSQSSVNVVVPPDVTAPTITALSVTPSIIWPPNGSMVPVSVSATATDDVDPSPVCGISGITATDPSTADWSITGTFTAMVRAKKNADGSAKVYSIAVTCSDFSGNTSTGVAAVLVTHDATVANTALKPKK